MALSNSWVMAESLKAGDMHLVPMLPCCIPVFLYLLTLQAAYSYDGESVYDEFTDLQGDTHDNCLQNLYGESHCEYCAAFCITGDSRSASGLVIINGGKGNSANTVTNAMDVQFLSCVPTGIY